MERTRRDEVFDWLAEEQRSQSMRDLEVRPRADAVAVNPVNGHGRGCECAQCPGWYERRAEMSARGVDYGQPQARRGSVLFDQVIPVCCLLAMVTVCGLVLLPVVVPLMAISAMMIIALAVVMTGGAVAVVYTVGALKRQARRDERPSLRGEVVRRQWR